MKDFKIILLFLIILLAAILRFAALDRYPAGFYSDESLYGYEAYSILKTGKDEYGNFLPVALRAFGDWRPPLYTYLTIPSVAIFGLNELATRLPAATFSFLTVIFLYFLAKEIFKSEAVALAASFLLAISPWSLHFARMAHETNLATLLIVLAVFFFFKGLKKNQFLPLAMIFFLVSLYAYYNTRVFVPLFLLLLFFIFRQEILLKKINYLLMVILVVILLLPLFSIFKNREMAWSRIDIVSLWQDPGLKLKIMEFQGEDKRMAFPYGEFFHNKAIDGVKQFFVNFFSHFEPQFLLFKGDPVRIYQVPENGILLWLEPVFLIVGFYKLLKNKKHFVFLSGWLFLAMVPDSLTRYAPAAARIHLALPVLSLVGGLGLWEILVFLKRKNFWVRLSLSSLMTAILVYNFIYFWHAYLVHLSLRYAKDWHDGLKEVVETTQEEAKNYQEIWVSRQVWGWINFLFFLKYSPLEFQKEVVLSPKNEYGLGWVYKFGKYYMDDLPIKYDFSQNILYLGAPEEFPKGVRPLKIIYYPDKTPAFYLIDREGLQL